MHHSNTATQQTPNTLRHQHTEHQTTTQQRNNKTTHKITQTKTTEEQTATEQKQHSIINIEHWSRVKEENTKQCTITGITTRANKNKKDSQQIRSATNDH